MNLRTAAPVRGGKVPGQRRGRLNIGRGHIAPDYLDAEGVALRRRVLVEEGYPAHLATLAVRLEGRENTLLDRTEDGLTSAEEAELKAVQRLLGELHREVREEREREDAEEAAYRASGVDNPRQFIPGGLAVL